MAIQVDSSAEMRASASLRLSRSCDLARRQTALASSTEVQIQTVMLGSSDSRAAICVVESSSTTSGTRAEVSQNLTNLPLDRAITERQHFPHRISDEAA